MTHRFSLNTWLRLASSLLLAGVAYAAPTTISNSPLVVANPDQAKANLLFVLDDSGSMGLDFLPDHINGDGSPDPALCRSGGANASNSGNFSNPCCHGGNNSNACWTGSAPFSLRAHPPFLAAGFNGMAYNPAVRYTPPVKWDGTSWPEQNKANTSDWKSVKNDAYNIQNTGSINLLTQFPDMEWCTDANFTTCLRNDNYVLPGNVEGADYTVYHATVATGTAFFAKGAPDAATKTATAKDLGPHYYNIVAAEYCTTESLRDCSTTPDASRPYPAKLRWCNSDANARASTPAANSCQAVRSGTFPHARYPTKFFAAGTVGNAEKAATLSFTVSVSSCGGWSSKKVGVKSLIVGGTDLFGGVSTADTDSASTLASAIVANIEAKKATTKFSASLSGSKVTITAPLSLGNYTASAALAKTNSSTCNFSPTAPGSFSGYTAAVTGTAGSFPGRFERVDIVPSRSSYPKSTARTDCTSSGSGCTYDEEMTNFANWWAYYHTRMQAMKSSAALAFGQLGSNRRLGYLSINNNTGSDYLNLDTFESTQRTNWFTKLTSARPNNSTPLRTALATAGRLYGGKLNGSNLNGSSVKDPIQYSCQKNYTILSTDGFWNESSNPKKLDGTDIGDQDSAASVSRPKLDGTATGNTLADTAYYYFTTDLRTGTSGSTACTSGSGSGADVCGNDTDTFKMQVMGTFTLGLGASGYMQFSPNYLSAASGDYLAVKNGVAADPSAGVCSWQSSGSCNWPVPVSNRLTAIDDLWHAAVNGGGTYYSATSPDDLQKGITAALASLEGTIGAAAAASTSNPNVTASDNKIFVSNFRSVEWWGDIASQKINVNTGAVEPKVDWSARSLLDANTSRKIYGFSSGESSKLREFTWSNLSAAEQGYFTIAVAPATTPRQLTQFCGGSSFCLETADQTAASGRKVFDFILGDRSNEGPLDDPKKYFRQRTSVLGDIVGSEAVYVSTSQLDFVDSGYDAFKKTTATRKGMIYVGANDGMLHAFRSDDGQEAWAYIPSAVIPNLYKLADKQYGTNHQYFVDGTATTQDVFINGQWRTVLIGGLGAGGRAYFALDVTEPDNPKGLWEFTDNNLGYTFGRPEIGKLPDGTWAVFLPSGYNNVSPGDGKARLFIRRISDGAEIRTITTSAGDTTTPAGLGHIRGWVDDGNHDNTVLRVYGGDNLGNVWRFDVSDTVGASGYEATLLATLKSATGVAQPVTSRPELALVGNKVMVYVGTGRYMGYPDLTDDSAQSIYGIKDKLEDTGWGNPRTPINKFVQQTLALGTCPKGSAACAEGVVTRNVAAPNPVNLETDGGWYVDLPATRERVNADPQLALGTLVVNSNVVNVGDVCTVGGSSWANYLDYKTGASVSTAKGVVSVPLGPAIATRPSIVKLPNGLMVSITRLSNDTTKTPPTPQGGEPDRTKSIVWRDFVQ
ncbi:pilus assembly protein [Roseateles sp.]|uniref:pilus assembly protein n=1 Tax=Roseateles sp. TaxID=1971397 RepID=UPI0039392959